MQVVDYRRYADTFWEELNETFLTKRGKYDYLPIVFADPEEANVDQSFWGITKTHINERTNKCSLFPVVFLHKNRTIDQIKETIRHEVIHYYLGLHYRNYSDDNILFHAVATIFDAGAYKEMAESQEVKKYIAIRYLQNTYELFLKGGEKDSVITNLALMLSEIDAAESESVDVSKLESSLKLLYQVAVTLVERNL